MTTQPPQLNNDDLELLSSYLDGQLAPEARSTLEARLQAEPELRAELDDLRATVAALRALDPVRPPRSFTLDPAQVAPRRAAPLGWARWFQVGGVVAAVVLVAVGLLSVAGSMGLGGAGAPVAAVATSAPEAALESAPAAREAMGTASATEEPGVMMAEAPAATPADDVAGDSAPAASQAAPEPVATVLVEEGATAVAGAAPPEQVLATPASSSPGTADLAQPTPIPGAPTAQPAPGLPVMIGIAAVVLLAGLGALAWWSSRRTRL